MPYGSTRERTSRRTRGGRAWQSLALRISFCSSKAEHPDDNRETGERYPAEGPALISNTQPPSTREAPVPITANADVNIGDWVFSGACVLVIPDAGWCRQSARSAEARKVSAQFRLQRPSFRARSSPSDLPFKENN